MAESLTRCVSFFKNGSTNMGLTPHRTIIKLFITKWPVTEIRTPTRI